MSFFELPAVADLARIVMTAPKGAAVTAALRQFHRLLAQSPEGDTALMQVLQYEAYPALKADAAVLQLEGEVHKSVDIALHEADILEAIREGTACDSPTLEDWDLTLLSAEVYPKWWNVPETMAQAEELFFETLDSLLQQTRNYPLTLEILQCLVTYQLTLALGEVSEPQYPRNETWRCMRLALYGTPWDGCRHSAAYICHKDGEVFLMDGTIDNGSCEDYLKLIDYLEEVVPQEELERYLKERTAQPCFDFELEKAVHIWLGNPPLRGCAKES